MRCFDDGIHILLAQTLSDELGQHGSFFPIDSFEHLRRTDFRLRRGQDADQPTFRLP
jgi:hypothetical protein